MYRYLDIENSDGQEEKKNLKLFLFLFNMNNWMFNLGKVVENFRVFRKFDFIVNCKQILELKNINLDLG